MKNSISIAVIMLHPGCNMMCEFCVTEDSLSVMSMNQALQLLHNLKERGIRNIVLGGGEPFTWPYDLIALSRIAKEMNFIVQVGTNGIALPPQFETIPSFDRFVLPLDSMNEHIHNQLRRFSHRHHSIILDRLKVLKKVGKEITVSTVVNKKNKDSLIDIGHFLQAYADHGGKVHAWHLYKFIPIGRGGSVRAECLAISDEAYQEVCLEVKEMDFDFSIFRRKDLYQSKTVDFFWYENGSLRNTRGYVCDRKLRQSRYFNSFLDPRFREDDKGI